MHNNKNDNNEHFRNESGNEVLFLLAFNDCFQVFAIIAMALASAGKALVKTDCTQHNPLVDLSRRVIEGSLDDDFENTWNQFLTKSSRSRDVSIADEIYPFNILN